MTPADAPVFRGVGVALLTLFDAHGELDAPATAALAAQLVERGVRAVVVAGTTGEAAALSAAERAGLLSAVRRAVTSVPVVAGTGAPSARQAVALTEAAAGGGADAVLVLSPPGAADPRPYYDAVAVAAGGVPVLAYHFPAVSPPGVPVELLGSLPVAGCKDSSGDADRLLRGLVEWGGPLYTGSSSLLSTAGALGAAGAVVGLANLDPEGCARAFAGDAAAQRGLVPAAAACRAPFPGALKAAVAARLGVPAVTRMG